MIHWLWLFLWSMFALANPPDSEEDAEIYRLRERLTKHYKHETWVGVEHTYNEMLVVDKKRMWITADDHLKGAMASSSMGDVEETIRRLEASLLVEERSSTVQWKESLEKQTGRVSLSSQKNQTLKNTEPLFSPELLQAIEFVNQTLAEKGHFKGRLPTGPYEYGEQRFVVTMEGMVKEEREKDKKPKKKNVVTEEKKRQSLLTISGAALYWSGSKSGHSGPIPFVGGGAIVGWERSFFHRSLMMGINPQIQLIAHGKGGVIGLLPCVYVGVQKGRFSWTVGAIQQTYIIAQTGFIMADGRELQDHVDKGFSLGWAGQSRIGWAINDRYGLTLQGAYGGDGVRWMSHGGIGVQRFF